ncbi:MAG TPA: dipeptidase [Pseudothermotoga sp.]
MKTFDTHTDIWYDVSLKKEKGKNDVLRTYHLPRLKSGNVWGINAAVWTNPKIENPMDKFLRILGARSEQIKLMNHEDFVFAQTHTQIVDALKNDKVAVISSIEGLIGIGKNVDFIVTLYELGFRIMSLTWNEVNDLAAGCGCDDASKGLSDLGKEAIKIMEKLGIILDISHLNEKSFWDVIKIAQKPVIATHSNVFSLCPVPRNLKDEQIKVIAQAGGLIGISALPQIVDRENPTIEKVIEHITYVANLVGIDHICLGFDFSDYLKTDESLKNTVQKQTTGLEDTTKVPALIELLEKNGFTQKEIEKISWHNFVNFLKDNLG